MGAVGLCISLVVLVNFHITAAKPFFGSQFWCDLFCDDDYDDLSDTASMEDIFDAIFDPCSDCPTNRPSSNALDPSAQQPFNIVIPPNYNGVNLTMVPNRGSWHVNYMLGSPSSVNAPATMAPAGSAKVTVTTAAPAAATTAAGTGTTAAGTGTTAAGTTAAATTKKA